jgi:hypothetical protein
MSSNVKTPLPNIAENNEKILGDIQNLQRMENKILQTLETRGNLSHNEITKMVDNLNQLSTSRVNLYTTLSNMSNFYTDALSSSTDVLKQQTAAINIVESELNRSKRRLQFLQMEKNNKIRLVEINEYYGDKYQEHADLMKIIIFTLIPIIIITFVYNRGLIPNALYYFLFIIIGVIGAVFFWRKYASIISRDNMNYDSYDWAFDPSTAPTGTSDDEDPWGKLANIGTCIGEACCSEGQLYDESLNVCILKPIETLQTESFIANNVYTKTQPGKYKADVDLKNNLLPYNS